MLHIDWNEKIKAALDRTEFMALATNGPEGVWVCPVAFAYSEGVDLYFISTMHSKHVQNLLSYPHVSVAIYKTERLISGDVIGLQLTGTASHVTDNYQVRVAARYYFNRSQSYEGFRAMTAERGGSNAPWQFFKVTPDALWYVDTLEFGEHRQMVNVSSLDLS